MKQFDKDFENISALIDNELREDQAAVYKEKVQNSPAYKEKYAEMAKIKQAVRKLPPLPEDHYFYTRLNEFIKTENKKTAKWKPFVKPAASLAVLTVVLMFFFRVSPEFLDRLVEDQKGNIVEFYTKNLRPYFQEDELSKDDIFNFAFSQVLPVDSMGTNVISLDGSKDGASIAIRQMTAGDSKISLKEFTEKLNLNQEQKTKLDGVLKKYESKIRKAILVNENNTVAVNANLWNYNKALKAEIMAIAAENQALAKVMPAAFLESMPAFSDIDFAENADDYVCINPDTVFIASIKVNTKDPKFNIPVANKTAIFANKTENFNTGKHKFGGYYGKNGDSSKSTKFKVFIDTNFLKFDIPEGAFEAATPDIMVLKRLDSLVDLSMKNLDLRFNFEGSKPGEPFGFKFKLDSMGVPGSGNIFEFKFDTSKGFNFDMHFPGKDSAGFKILVPEGIEKLEDLKGLGNLDSLMIFKFKGKDSTFNFNFPFKNFDGNMKQFQEEMNKFREEMDKFRDEMKQLKPKPKKEKKAVVI